MLSLAVDAQANQTRPTAGVTIGFLTNRYPSSYI